MTMLKSQIFFTFAISTLCCTSAESPETAISARDHNGDSDDDELPDDYKAEWTVTQFLYHNAYIDFDKSSAKSFLNCLSNKEKYICKVQVKFTYGTNYHYEAQDTKGESGTNDETYTSKFKCEIPNFASLPEGGYINCSRINVPTSTRDCPGTFWSYQLNTEHVDFIWNGDQNLEQICTSEMERNEFSNCQCDSYENRTCSPSMCKSGETLSQSQLYSTTALTPFSTHSENQNTDLGIIIGLVCAAVVIVVVVIIICLVIRNRRVKNKQATDTATINNFHSNESSNHVNHSRSDAAVENTNDTCYAVIDNVEYGSRNDNNETTYSSINSTSISSRHDVANDNITNNGKTYNQQTNNVAPTDTVLREGNETSYSTLGAETHHQFNPYNKLLKPKQDVKSRDRIPVPVNTLMLSNQEPVPTSLSHHLSVTDSFLNKPIEIIDVFNKDNHSIVASNNELLGNTYNSKYGVIADNKQLQLQSPQLTIVMNDKEFGPCKERTANNDSVYFTLEKEDACSISENGDHS